MDLKENNASIKFKSKAFDDHVNGYHLRFENIPNDLKKLLEKPEGTMSAIVGNLYPDQVYEIEISIKSV